MTASSACSARSGKNAVFLVRTEELAAFCGIPGGGFEPGRAHAYASPKRYGVLDGIPDAHLLEVTERQCGALFRDLFPDGDLAAEIRALRGREVPPGEAQALHGTSASPV